MLLLDVNILVYAHREDAPGHEAFRRWLEETIAADAAFAVPELVLSGFLRVVTHPRIFAPRLRSTRPYWQSRHCALNRTT